MNMKQKHTYVDWYSEWD